jgi:hypothetical protein
MIIVQLVSVWLAVVNHYVLNVVSLVLIAIHILVNHIFILPLILLRIDVVIVLQQIAFAGSLASGLQGIEDKLVPPPLFEGDIYQAKQLPEVPKTLAAANKIFANSDFAKHAFGADVVKHYARMYSAFASHNTTADSYSLVNNRLLRC